MSDRRAWFAVSVAAASIFLFVADAGLVALALPKIEQQFPHVARATLAWMATGFLVAQASLLLVGGRLSDRYGRKRFYLFGLFVFSIGSGLTALAPTVGLILAARVVQGAGAAFLASSALALVLPMFPASKSPMVIGAWGGIGSVAGWLTPTAGALVVDANWRVAFAVVAVVGLAVFLLGRIVLVEQKGTDGGGRTDRVSYLLGPPALGATILVLAQGTRWGWTSVPVLGLAVFAAGMLIAFIRRCALVDNPLLDVNLVHVRAYTANAVAGAIQQVAFFGWFVTGPLVMTALWGWSVREAGLAIAIGQFVAGLSSPIGGRLVTRFGHTPPVVVSALVTAAGSVWLLATATARPNFGGVVLPALVVMGLGSGICGTMTTGAALAALPAAMLGAGNSVVQLVRRMGGALGVAVAVALLGNGRGAELLVGARRVWWMVTILHIVMSVPLLFASRRWQLQHRHLARVTTDVSDGALGDT